MSRERFTIEQIINHLREAEVLPSQGQRVGEICRRLGIAEQTCYRWRREYGGLKLDRGTIVTGRLTAHENHAAVHHRVRVDVRNLEAEHLLAEIDRAGQVGEGEHDMADLRMSKFSSPSDGFEHRDAVDRPGTRRIDAWAKHRIDGTDNIAFKHQAVHGLCRSAWS